MDIEIIEFYPIEWRKEQRSLSGTLRIKLVDIGLHLLGIFACRNVKGDWFFQLPGRKGTHHETGEFVRYPLISFENKEKQKALMEAIREKAPVFIEKRLDQENSINSPETKLNESEQDRQPKSIESSTDEKQKASIAKPKSAALKDWQDPPKRKPVSQKPFVNR
jgi:hypothetical protein